MKWSTEDDGERRTAELCAGVLAKLIAWFAIPDERKGEEIPARGGAGADETVRIAVGVGLVAVGALALFGRLIGSDFWHVAWPVVLIGIGIAVIAHGWRR